MLDYRYDETRNDRFKTYNIWLKNFSLWFHEKTGSYPEENSDWFYRYDTIKDANDPNSFHYYYKKEMQKDLPVITLTFRTASYVKFFVNPEEIVFGLTKNNLLPCADCTVGDDYSLYDILIDGEKFIGQDFYLLAQWAYRDHQFQKTKTEEWLSRAFERTTEVKSFESKRYGKSVGSFVLYKLENYLGKNKAQQP